MHLLNIQESVRKALMEDLGGGDITAQLLPDNRQVKATIITREHCILCGQAWLEQSFFSLDPRINIQWFVKEGDSVAKDSVLCELTGPARALLSAERTALNFLQTLSGTATRVNQYVNAIAGEKAQILDTRKTIPGLRQAQKYAVQCGGGKNHRMGLYDGILIKENHILAAGSIAQAIEKARLLSSSLPIEVEVEDLDQLKQALTAKADIILLDNMNIEMLTEAVAITDQQTKLEASGGIDLHNVKAIAATGVDFISIGEMTKNITAIDLSMRIK